jgi:holo-[acyl-carrier protein] synthase
LIKGIGIDLIEVNRVERSLGNQRFLDKVFTLEEQKMLAARKMNPQTAAGSFAAKEAVAKALGTGFGYVGWTEIEILRQETGRPYVVLYGSALKVYQTLGCNHIWISITHTKEYAAAKVILEGE